MPGVVQHTKDSFKAEINNALHAGIGGVMIFGIPQERDAVGTQAQRSDCVERGLQDWRLRLINAHGLRFLGSIAFQGGLPGARLKANS